MPRPEFKAVALHCPVWRPPHVTAEPLNMACLKGDVLDFFENYYKKNVKYEYFINNLK